MKGGAFCSGSDSRKRALRGTALRNGRTSKKVASKAARVRPVLACQDNLAFMAKLPAQTVKLIVTSPPYNLGKDYEAKVSLDAYLETQARVIKECVRILHPQGSVCWQVGNYVENGEIIPLDTVLYPVFREEGLKLRNRIIWHFGHGLHCTKTSVGTL